MLRLWLLRMVPFLDRWLEVSPACCGTCPTCLGAAATGVTTTFVGTFRRGE